MPLKTRQRRKGSSNSGDRSVSCIAIVRRWVGSGCASIHRTKFREVAAEPTFALTGLLSAYMTDAYYMGGLDSPPSATKLSGGGKIVEERKNEQAVA
jgi:hypothetical protein